MNILKPSDILNSSKNYPKFNEEIKAEIDENNISRARKENIIFWVPFTMSVIAILIASTSLWLQYKTIPNTQPLKPIKDTVHIPVPYNSPKSESLKQTEIKKK